MRRLAALLLGAGVAIWLLGLIAWVFGVWVTLPPAATRVLVLALAALSGGVLVAAGASLGRTSRRGVTEHTAERQG
jgi:membrane protein implicated in regulation of membrane protease activity